MSKCAFPLWLLNNSHISFTLIKIKVLLPLLLLFSLHVTFTIFFPLQLLLPSHISEFSMLSLYPPSAFSPTVFLFASSCFFVSLSLSSGTFLTPRHVSFVSLYLPACAAQQQNIAQENDGKHKAVVCSLPVNPVMIYVHSVSHYLAITPGSHRLRR